jgi:hypothetical protein
VDQEQRRLQRMRGISEGAALRSELIEVKPCTTGNPQRTHDQIHGCALSARHAAPMPSPFMHG